MTKEVKPKKKAERGDKIRTRAKVMVEVIKDPTQSQRDIAKKTWVPKSTVADHMKNLGDMGKIGHIEKVIENDSKIVNLWQEIIIQRMELAKEDPKAMSTRDIITAQDLSGKRRMLLVWDVTNDKWWLKEVIDEEKLKAIQSLANSFWIKN